MKRYKTPMPVFGIVQLLTIKNKTKKLQEINVFFSRLMLKTEVKM